MQEEKNISHIAIIMDGNRRWAKDNNLLSYYGHKIGLENLFEIAQYCIELNVKYLTVYAFSTENFNRSPKELKYLTNILTEYVNNKSNLLKISNAGIDVSIIGDLSMFKDENVPKFLNTLENNKPKEKKISLQIAAAYGGRREIMNAAINLAKDYKNNIINENELIALTEKQFVNYLYTKQIPDPDIFIRTGGDENLRISNFLLWQISYTELFFSSKMWPEFNKDNLNEIIDLYYKRNRKYGV